MADRNQQPRIALAVRAAYELEGIADILEREIGSEPDNFAVPTLVRRIRELAGIQMGALSFDGTGGTLRELQVMLSGKPETVSPSNGEQH
jgi:hypothetical protein